MTLTHPKEELEDTHCFQMCQCYNAKPTIEIQYYSNKLKTVNCFETTGFITYSS